jgi:hypothetical protein
VADCDTCHSPNTWLPANFNHDNVTGTCSNCHNGVAAMGKPNNHVTTTSDCEVCHSTNAWTPAGFDHSNATGVCDGCHNNVVAQGKDTSHFITSRQCHECHNTQNWQVVDYNHNSANYPGDHGGRLGCVDCHEGNAEAIPWPNASYRPDCAACHARDYRNGPHKKTENPTTIFYSVSELRDCSGACHRYTDDTFSVIERTRTGEHRAGREW